MRRGQRPAHHFRRIRTKRGMRTVIVNPSVQKRRPIRKNYGAQIVIENDDEKNRPMEKKIQFISIGGGEFGMGGGTPTVYNAPISRPRESPFSMLTGGNAMINMPIQEKPKPQEPVKPSKSFMDVISDMTIQKQAPRSQPFSFAKVASDVQQAGKKWELDQIEKVRLESEKSAGQG